MATAPEWTRTGQNIPRFYYYKQLLPTYQPKAAVFWGATALTAAIFLVQPFDWIDKTFLNPPKDKEEES